MILLGLLSCRLLPYISPCLCNNRILWSVGPISINPALLFLPIYFINICFNVHCKFTPMLICPLSFYCLSDIRIFSTSVRVEVYVRHL